MTLKLASDSHMPLSRAVTLPDGGVKEGVAGVTTPLDIAIAISKSLAKKVLISRWVSAGGITCSAARTSWRLYSQPCRGANSKAH